MKEKTAEVSGSSGAVSQDAPANGDSDVTDTTGRKREVTEGSVEKTSADHGIPKEPEKPEKDSKEPEKGPEKLSGKPEGIGHKWARFYWGSTNVDFVSRARIWFTISGIALLFSMLALVFNGLNLSIEFEGGTSWAVEVEGFTTVDAQDALSSFDLGTVVFQEVGDGVRVEARELTAEQSRPVTLALGEAAGVDAAVVSVQTVGPSWGEKVSRHALQGLVVFLVLVVLYISLRFEPKMAVTAIAAVLHDLLVTVGVYALLDFQVSPATVIGVLTMLGYSLYDSVVVFDKVRENERAPIGQKLTYPELVNVSMNQTITRSLATSITSVLPAASLLFIGSALLGAVTLRDLALALFVGIVSGTYSSIFFASPILAKLKSNGWVVAKRSPDTAKLGEASSSVASGAISETHDGSQKSGEGKISSRTGGKIVAGKTGSARKHGRATGVPRKRR